MAETAKRERQAMQQAVLGWLEACGLDPQHADLARTPERVAELWSNEFLAGYAMDPARILDTPVVGESDPDAVVVTDLAFHAMCPHHLLPFQGRAHLAYLPAGKLVGFGALGSLVACFTKRLTLQERATHQIATALIEHLGARGAGCVLEANQLCLGIRHDQHASNHIVTTAFLGAFEEQPELRAQLLACCREARRT